MLIGGNNEQPRSSIGINILKGYSKVNCGHPPFYVGQSKCIQIIGGGDASYAYMNNYIESIYMSPSGFLRRSV